MQFSFSILKDSGITFTALQQQGLFLKNEEHLYQLLIYSDYF